LQGGRSEQHRSLLCVNEDVASKDNTANAAQNEKEKTFLVELL
jgi:hypothetical protein